MASIRPYRPALRMDKAMEEIKGGMGTLYDARVVESCVRLLEGGFSFR